MLLTSKFSHAVRLLGKYDALDSSRHGCHIVTGQSRHNQSPYSKPTDLIAPYESISTLPAPAAAAAVLLSIEAVSSHRKYPGMVGRVSSHEYRRGNRRLILKPLSPPL
jgi:hypothetical protein